eukprot:g10846.t1
MKCCIPSSAARAAKKKAAATINAEASPKQEKVEEQPTKNAPATATVVVEEANKKPDHPSKNTDGGSTTDVSASTTATLKAKETEEDQTEAHEDPKTDPKDEEVADAASGGLLKEEEPRESSAAAEAVVEETAVAVEGGDEDEAAEGSYSTVDADVDRLIDRSASLLKKYEGHLEDGEDIKGADDENNDSVSDSSDFSSSEQIAEQIAKSVAELEEALSSELCSSLDENEKNIQEKSRLMKAGLWKRDGQKVLGLEDYAARSGVEEADGAESLENDAGVHAEGADLCVGKSSTTRMSSSTFCATFSERILYSLIFYTSLWILAHTVATNDQKGDLVALTTSMLAFGLAVTQCCGAFGWGVGMWLLGSVNGVACQSVVGGPVWRLMGACGGCGCNSGGGSTIKGS